MKKKAIYLIFFVLPGLLFVFSIAFKDIRGPHYIRDRCDPEYAYLLGSLNAANFKSSIQTIHPGTPVQMIGGAVLRLHSLNYSNLQKDVLIRPEYYLSHLNYFVIIIIVIMLIIVGMVAYFFTGDILPGLIIQLTPFLSGTILRALPKFNPNPFLIFSTLLLIVFILIKLYKIADDNWKLTLIFAIIGGFGLAVKFPFLPLLIIPLFLFKKFSTILKYISLTAVVFFLFWLPYYQRFIHFIGWLWNVAGHTGKYGKGRAGILDLSTMLPNIGKLFRKEPLFMYTLLLLIVFIGINLAIPRMRKLALKSIIFRVMLGLLTANMISIIITLKHFSLKYPLPGFSLTGLVIALTYLYLKDLSNEFGFNKQLVKFSFIFIFILAGFFSYQRLPNLEAIAKKRDKILAQYQKVWKEYKDYKKIFYYMSTSQHYALRFGNKFAASYHTNVLESIYGNDVYFYDIFSECFCEWQKIISPRVIAFHRENTIMVGLERTAGEQRKSIVDMTRQILARYNLKLVNTMPDNWGETIFKFEKNEPDADFETKQRAAMIKIRNSKTLDIAENIIFIDQFKLIKAFTQKNSKLRNITLNILWESLKYQEVVKHKLAITLVRNGRNIFTRYPFFSEYKKVIDKGELVHTIVIIPQNRLMAADFIGIRVNFQRQNRMVSLKVKSNSADQNQCRFLIPIGDTIKKTF